MTTFKLLPDGAILRGDGMSFVPYPPGAAYPPSGEQRDYQAFLAGGGVPAMADPAPLVFSREQPVAGRARTTDATVTEVYRATLQPLTGYAAVLALIGVDAGNGAVRIIRASVAAKRLGSAAILVGGPVVLASHADAGAISWAVNASVSGNDVVVTVTGAAGRTIDWSVAGTVVSFTPGGA